MPRGAERLPIRLRVKPTAAFAAPTQSVSRDQAAFPFAGIQPITQAGLDGTGDAGNA